MADEDDPRKVNTAAQWARYSQVAFIIPAGVVAGLLVGKLFDHWLHTRWLFLVGIILGSISGFVEMIRMITKGKN